MDGIEERGAGAGAPRLPHTVGLRVRRAREMKGISRRVLSERSGVSQRHLAQLETGSGNISLALLQDVAAALDHRIEWLVGEEDPWTSDGPRVAELFRRAGPDQRARVLKILEASPARAPRGRRACLVGLRGAGKSTLGALVAGDLGCPFVELNRRIEALCGMPVGDLMALYGQEGYRRIEREALAEVARGEGPLILAVAGGIVAEPETFGTLLSQFHTIWLRAAPEEHMTRVRAQGDERPMAGDPKALEALRSILTSREEVYARAEAILDTSGRSLEQSRADLRGLIEARGFLG